MPNNDGFDDEFTNILDDEQEDEYEDTVEEDEDYGNLDEDFGDPENEEYEDDVEETEEIEETESPDTEDTPEQSSSSDNVRIENFYKGIDWNSYKKSYGDRVSYFRLLCLMGYRVALKNMKDMYEVMTDTALDFSLSLCRENNIPAANDELSTAYMKAVAELFSETSNTKIKVMEDLEQRCLNDDSFAMVTVHNGDNAVGDERHFTVYILILVYLVSAMGILTSDDIIVTDSGKIGFKGSLGEDGVLSECLKNQLRDKRLSKYENYIPSSLKLAIEQNLNLKLSDGSIEEYFKNKVYVADERVIQDVVEPPDTEDNKLIKDMLKCANDHINMTSNNIKRILRDCFTSCYQVIKPYGVLCEDGILTKTPDLEADYNYDTSNFYNVLMSKLGYVECKTNEYNWYDNEKIANQYEANKKKILYFPEKIAEYAFGFVYNGGTYEPSPNATSWDAYYNAHVKNEIFKLLKGLTLRMFKRWGFDKNKKYRTEDAGNKLLDFFGYVERCFTAGIVVVTWGKLYEDPTDKESNYEATGFKIRVVDRDRHIPLDTKVVKEMLDRAKHGNLGDEDAVLEPATFIGLKTSYSVVDIQHKYKPKIVDASPMFAYVALRALNASKVDISWEQIPLGKSDDESILCLGKDISLKDKFCHWVIAGSRSGKGVMTLNILASAIACKRPIFYLDNKPDMASLFRSSQLSGGKMFCVNGDHGDTYDVLFHSCSPESFNWDRNIPPYIKKAYGSDYNKYSALFYLRAVMFLTSLIYVRGNVREDATKYNKLGGKEGIVIVMDEITGADRSINALLGKGGNVGDTFYSSNTLNAVRKAIKKSKDKGEDNPTLEINELGCWNTDFMNTINATMNEIGRIWQHKGLVGGGTEGEVSNLFIIGQELNSYDDSKFEYKPNNDNTTNGTCGDAFYNFLFSLGGDAFFGRNPNHPEYMCTSKESAQNGGKAATRLNDSARNFAYVDKFTHIELKQILESDEASSRDISNSAKYFKPLLIFNDAGEDTSYIDEDFRAACDKAGLDFEETKNQHRTKEGVLEPAIGFIPYMTELAKGDLDVKSILAKSYDIANELVKAYIPDYDGDCINFIYDLRPEAMFSCKSLLSAYAHGICERQCVLYDEFFGESGSSAPKQDFGGNRVEDNTGDNLNDLCGMSEDDIIGDTQPTSQTTQPTPQATQPNTQPTNKPTREQVIDYYIQKATDMLLPRFESIMAQNQALADLLRSNGMTMETLLKQVCTPFATKRYESVGDMYYGK